MILKDGAVLEHYWGKALNVRTGRDQLGMQATSLVTYATLLPGLTNLTQRIRYYSFYAWLIKKVIEERKPKDLKFNNYIRRAELLFAFSNLMFNKEQKGIPGSDFVKTILKEHKGWPKDNHVLDIASNADKIKGQKTYWTYSKGAFGQYYLGPLSKIGIIKRPELDKDKISLSEDGIRLAEAFENSISTVFAESFLSAIVKGKIKIGELRNLCDKINCDSLLVSHTETHLLLEFLLKPLPTKDFRRETILLMLEYIKSAEIESARDDFPRAVYYGCCPDGGNPGFHEFTTTLELWRFFRINEYAHYACESILHFLLSYLCNAGIWISIDDCVAHFSKSVLKDINRIAPKIKDINKNTSLEKLIDSCSAYNNAKWFKTGSPDWLLDDYRDNERVATTVLSILCLFSKHKQDIAKFQNLAGEFNILREGSFIELFDDIAALKHQSFAAFLKEFLVRHIIERHLRVAYEKINQRELNTLKFEYQDGALYGIAPDKATWTSPRLGALYNFLNDLKLVKNSILTSAGKTVYDKHIGN